MIRQNKMKTAREWSEWAIAESRKQIDESCNLNVASDALYSSALSILAVRCAELEKALESCMESLADPDIH